MIFDVSLAGEEILIAPRGGFGEGLANWLAREVPQADPRLGCWAMPASFPIWNAAHGKMREKQIKVFGDEAFGARHAEWREEERRAREVVKERAKRIGLFPFQQTGAEWLSGRTKALLGDDMGVGKSAQVLAALPAAPTLIVAPAAARGVWRREAKRWRPDLSVEILSGRGSFRWPTKPDEIVVTGPEILPPALLELAPRRPGRLKDPPEPSRNESVLWQRMIEKKPEFAGRDGKKKLRVVPKYDSSLGEVPAGSTIVFDEAHLYKEEGSNRSRNARAVSHAVLARGGRAWAVTATPMLNEPFELLSLMQLIDSDKDVFTNFFTFLDLFNAKKLHFGGFKFGEPNPEVPIRLSRVMLRREKHEVLPEIPEKIYEVLDVPLADDDEDAILDMVHSFAAAGVDVLRAKEIAELATATKHDAVLLSSVSRVRAALAASKIAFLNKWLEPFEEANEPVVAFSVHAEPVKLLAKRKGWMKIDGTMADHEREAVAADFQEGKIRGIAATIGAGGVAITLTRSRRVVFLDRLWTPLLNDQAEDRCCRIGQTRGVIITDLVSDHEVERHVHALLRKKRTLVDAVMGTVRP